MNRIFVTSDLWFNRPTGNLSGYTATEYNDIIINNWNEVVGKRDDVYILGGLGIGDMYHLIVRLNGRIHILNNFYTNEEMYFKDLLKTTIEQSSDKSLKRRITFETDQMISIPQFDTILSYFPLAEWYGRKSGTFCFYGGTAKSNFQENAISCISEIWKNRPIEIIEVQSNINKFKENI